MNAKCSSISHVVQFFGSDAGRRAACVWYTLIQSARANHVHVLPYLNDVLVRLPQIVPEYLRVGDALEVNKEKIKNEWRC